MLVKVRFLAETFTSATEDARNESESMAKKKRPQTKDDRFNFRISADEKERFAKVAARDGFDSLSTWFLWLARQREKEVDAERKERQP
jgi:hypothetical protein